MSFANNRYQLGKVLLTANEADNKGILRNLLHDEKTRNILPHREMSFTNHSIVK
jgi:hypothetical protein